MKEMNIRWEKKENLVFFLITKEFTNVNCKNYMIAKMLLTKQHTTIVHGIQKPYNKL